MQACATGWNTLVWTFFSTLFAFVLDSPYLHPRAHATAAIALYAIWDYTRAAPKAARPL